MKKRAQVAVFVIIAIIIVVSIILYFVLKDTNFLPANTKAEAVRSFVEDCIKEKTKEGVYILSTQGGFHIPPQEHCLSIGVPVYAEDFPFIENPSVELEKFMDENLKECTDGFYNLPQYLISSGNVSSEAEISEEVISFDVNFPLSIEEEDQTYAIENFNNIKVESNFGKLYNTAKRVYEMETGENKDCLSCLSELAEEEEVIINFYDFGNNDSLVTIYEITDENIQVYEENSTFTFAIKNEI